MSEKKDEEIVRKEVSKLVLSTLAFVKSISFSCDNINEFRKSLDDFEKSVTKFYKDN